MAAAARRFRYIVVEGVIGVGKTTLVHQLSRTLSARTVLEEFEENPFLPDFYRDRRAFALSTQIFFLMSRFRQQEVLAQGELFSPRTVSDYMFDKDRIFAHLTLERHELAIYEQLFEVLRPQVPKPDLVIFLRASHRTVMRRIQERGRAYELNMDPAYIEQLDVAYRQFFADFDMCPVITIDSGQVDFRERGPLLDELVSLIESGQNPKKLSFQITGAPTTPKLPGF